MSLYHITVLLAKTPFFDDVLISYCGTISKNTFFWWCPYIILRYYRGNILIALTGQQAKFEQKCDQARNLPAIRPTLPTISSFPQWFPHFFPSFPAFPFSFQEMQGDSSVFLPFSSISLPLFHDVPLFSFQQIPMGGSWEASLASTSAAFVAALAFVISSWKAHVRNISVALRINEQKNLQNLGTTCVFVGKQSMFSELWSESRSCFNFAPWQTLGPRCEGLQAVWFSANVM